MLYMPLACQEYLLNQSAVVVPGFALTLCSLDLITVSGYTKNSLRASSKGVRMDPGTGWSGTWQNTSHITETQSSGPAGALWKG